MMGKLYSISSVIVAAMIITCLILVFHSSDGKQLHRHAGDGGLEHRAENNGPQRLCRPDVSEETAKKDGHKRPGHSKSEETPGFDIDAHLQKLQPSDSDIERKLTAIRKQQIIEAQDKAMSTWPAYSELKDKLRRKARLKLKNLETEEVIELCRSLREKFWSEGGCLSAASFKYAYKARALLEELAAGHPGNDRVLDELVETIAATELTHNTENNKRKFNKKGLAAVLDIRKQQYQRFLKTREIGQEITKKHMIRAYDYGFLLQQYDIQAALPVYKKMAEIADKERMSGFLAILKPAVSLLEKDSHCDLPLYYPEPNYHENLKFSRHLPSFRGPENRDVKFVKDWKIIEVNFIKGEKND